MTKRLTHVMASIAAFGIVLLPAPFVFDVIDTSIYLLDEDMVQAEDLYLATERAQVDGVIDGDLVVAAGSLTITGAVTGDVLVISQGKVLVTGEVQGSVRGSAREVVVEGSVGDDVSVAAVTVRIEGTVERDVLVVAGSFSLAGAIGRDLRGRFITGSLNGDIGNDVDVTVQNLTVGSEFESGGDLIYRSTRDATIDEDAVISGQLIRLPSEGTFVIELWLTIARALSIVAFIVSGIVLLWLFRHTGARAAGLVRTKPGRTLLVGLGTLVLAPLVIVLLVATIVGVPVAILLMILYALGLLLSPIPAVTAFGSLVLGGRGGLFGAFVLGGLVWRFGIELIPFVGVALYLAALVWGTGGWVLAAWEERRRAPQPEPLLPAAMRVAPAESETPEWVPPLPPAPATEDDGVSTRAAEDEPDMSFERQPGEDEASGGAEPGATN
jgi:cytoskeletal protein CcmA (bactofilin family)